LPTFTGISLEEEGRTPGTCWKNAASERTGRKFCNHQRDLKELEVRPSKQQQDLKEPGERLATSNRIWKNRGETLETATGSE
jgi:hypothetical protein